jgi:hypothetical protein
MDQICSSNLMTGGGLFYARVDVRVCMCIPTCMQAELLSGMRMLQWCMGALAVLAIALLAVGAWYTFEVSRAGGFRVVLGWHDALAAASTAGSSYGCMC